MLDLVKSFLDKFFEGMFGLAVTLKNRGMASIDFANNAPEVDNRAVYYAIGETYMNCSKEIIKKIIELWNQYIVEIRQCQLRLEKERDRILK